MSVIGCFVVFYLVVFFYFDRDSKGDRISFPGRILVSACVAVVFIVVGMVLMFSVLFLIAGINSVLNG